MKKIKRMGICLLAAFLLLCDTAVFVNVAVPTENENFSLSVTKEGFITLTCKKTGNVYTSNPAVSDDMSGLSAMEAKSMLIVDVFTPNHQMTKINSYVGCVNKKGLTIKQNSDSVTLIYSFPEKEADFEIPVKITLFKDRVSAEILTDKIKENGSTQIVSISLMPFFGAGSETDEGYIFIPDGSGAIINFNNNKGNYYQYNEAVYGRDSALSLAYEKTVTEKIHLPVFGIKKNKKSFLAVIEKGQYDANIAANVAGSIESPYFNQVFSQFYYRKSDTIVMAEASFSARTVITVSKTKNNKTNYCVSYYLLNGGGYAEMARKYSEILNIKSKDTYKSPGVSLELIGGVQKKASFLGIPYNKYIPLTTFSQAQSILESLREDGVKDIAVSYKGWMKNGVYHSFDFSMKPDSRLGGQKGYSAFEAYCNENNISLYADLEFQKIYQNSGGVNKRFDAVKSLGSIPMMFYPLNLTTSRKNTSSSLSWSLIKSEKLQKITKNYQKNAGKIGNISAGDLGNLVYSDFAKDDARFRSDAINSIKKTFEAMDEKSVAVNGANDYVMVYADQVFNAPVGSSSFNVCDYEIPFYQMAIGANLNISTPAINLQGDANIAFLKAMQTGCSLGYTLMFEENSKIKNTVLSDVYGANHKSWEKIISSQYKAISQIKNREIIDFVHFENGITKTVYGDGLTVYINLSNREAAAENVTVKAWDYKVVAA